MILFFYGEDSYRISQQTKKLKAKFISASLGDTNLSIIDAKSANYNDIVRAILAMPFLSKTRLVIIENVISESQEENREKIGEFLKKVPTSTVLVLTQIHPDKRTSLYKKLLKADKVAEFPALQPEQVKRWIKKEVEERGGDIDIVAINKLQEYVGNDLWRLSNEIDKLISFNKNITAENIELLVSAQIENNIFKLTDAVARKNLQDALREHQNLVSSGEHGNYILSMLVYQYRNLLILKDTQTRAKTTSSWDLAKKSGIHPYAAQKIWPLLNLFSLPELKKSYKLLLDFDVALKTGKIEEKTGLTLLIIKLISSKSK